MKRPTPQHSPQPAPVVTKRFVVIGAGGIGSWVIQGLAPYLAFQKEVRATLVVVDGDDYEEKNKSRQAFTILGPKAEVQCSWIAERFPNLSVRPLAQYLSPHGDEEDTCAMADAVEDGDTVFLCVDNHKTRKFIADFCAELRNITLISGGNEYEDGNMQVFIRKDGKDLTCRLETYHPELAAPDDKAPFEMSCEELAAVSTPQLIFANMFAANLMLCAFHSIRQGKFDCEQSETYFDVLAHSAARRARPKK